MRTLRLITVVGVLLFACKSVSAQFVFGAHVIKVVDLPNTPEFELPAVNNTQAEAWGIKEYGDLGIAHKQFCFVFPVWNYGEPRYVLYREKCMYDACTEDYITQDLSHEEIAYFHELYGIPMTPEIPFWHKWGGKIYCIIFIVLSIWIMDNSFSSR